MNQVETERVKQERKGLLEFSDRSHVGCVRINSTNTLKHELAKFLICWKLSGGRWENVNILELISKIDQFVFEGEDFITEARKYGGKRRYDVFGLTRNIYEVERHSYKKNDDVITIEI